MSPCLMMTNRNSYHDIHGRCQKKLKTISGVEMYTQAALRSGFLPKAPRTHFVWARYRFKIFPLYQLIKRIVMMSSSDKRMPNLTTSNCVLTYWDTHNDIHEAGT